MRGHQEIIQNPAEGQADLQHPPTALLFSATISLLNKCSDPPQSHPHGIIIHVSEAHPKPPRFAAMERASGRHIQLHLVDYDPPQLQFCLKRCFPQQPPQIHPEKQPCVALQRPDSHLCQSPCKRPVPPA